MSYPSGHSVNDGVEIQWCSFRYASVDDAVHLISASGSATILIKVDLKNADCIVLVHPYDCFLLEIH